MTAISSTKSYGPLSNLSDSSLEDFSEGLQRWERVIGPDGISTDSETLSCYQRSCGRTGHRPTAVLFPRSTAEVSKILSISQQLKLPVYPVSRGRNSGYGSASPSASQCAIIDLRRMNRILEVNEELAYAVVEPGVTQQQLYEHLRDTGSRLWMDVTGASPHSSLIGNLVERGYGLSPAGDRFGNSCGFEVVLPTGDVIETGFVHIPGQRVGYLHRTGIGPSLDGIFTQSNLGIVTRAGLWLMPKPECAEVVSIEFPSDAVFAQGVERLRELKLRGLFPSPVHLANDLRVISVFQQYPFEVMQNRFPLSEAALDMLKQRWGVNTWNCVAGFWGTKLQVRAMKRALTEGLKGIARPRFVSRELVNFVAARRWLHWLPGARDLDRKMGLLRLLEGAPSQSPQNAGYWRKRSTSIPKEPDLERDNCGVIWVSPIVPSLQSEIQHFMNLTRRTCAEYRLETNVTVSMTTDRACCCTVALLFDPDEPTEKTAALEAHHVLLERYLAAGYPPYRAGSDWGDLMSRVLEPRDPFVQTVKKVKAALDPAQTLAPGRYGF